MKHLIALTQDQDTQALLRSIASVINVRLDITSSLANTIDSLSIGSKESCIVLIGLEALKESQRSVTRAIAKLRERAPNACIVLHAERRWLIDKCDEAWARMCGANDIVARITATRWTKSGDTLLLHLEPDESSRLKIRQRIGPYLRAAQQIELRQEALKQVAAAEAMGLDLAALAKHMGRSGGVDIQDRTYRLRTYPECFVASEGAAWLARAVNSSSAVAIEVGRAIQTCGLIYHVAREQDFDDAYYFFRVASLPESFVIADFHAQVSTRAGFEQRDRTYLGSAYPNCFVGKEAIAWCRSRRLTLNEAMTATQRLMDLSIASHVTGDHAMKDEALFYRFHAA